MQRDYPDRPIVGVGAVVFKDDAVLLIRRAKPPRAGQWSLPGGVQELGETWAECAHREIAEETGVEIELIGLVDVVDAITPDDDARIARHFTLVDVAGRVARRRTGRRRRCRRSPLGPARGAWRVRAVVGDRAHRRRRVGAPATLSGGALRAFPD